MALRSNNLKLMDSYLTSHNYWCLWTCKTWYPSRTILRSPKLLQEWPTARRSFPQLMRCIANIVGTWWGVCHLLCWSLCSRLLLRLFGGLSWSCWHNIGIQKACRMCLRQLNFDCRVHNWGFMLLQRRICQRRLLWARGRKQVCQQRRQRRKE